MVSNPSRFKGSRNPVEEIQLGRLPAILRENSMRSLALGEETYRLPTEAEWEYACLWERVTSFATGV